MSTRIRKRTVWLFVFGTLGTGGLHWLQPSFWPELQPYAMPFATKLLLSLAVGAGVAYGDILFGDRRIWHLWTRRGK